MSKELENYEPFGEAWEKEIKNLPKDAIIKMFAKKGKELDETKDLLLQATQNLGHPAYEHSYNTKEAIDNLREKCFDFLGVPK